MALVIQNNPPVTGANSYASLDAFKARLTTQLRDFSGKTDEQLTAALIAGTEYLDIRFGYVGYRVSKEQDTEWPRQNAYDSRGDKVDGIPGAVQRATMEYAWRALSGPLLPDPEVDPSGRAVESKSSTVGPISESVKYARADADWPSYPAADGLLTRRGLVASAPIGGLAVRNTARG